MDRYGGWTGAKLEATPRRPLSNAAAAGWFHTAHVKEKWCLVDPDGNQFYSAGVNTISFRQDTIRDTNESPYGETTAAKYGQPGEWAKAAVARLRNWGFNTIGAWSDRVTWQQGMPYTVILHFADSVKREAALSFPDVFDPEFERELRTIAQRVCRPLADDRWLIGYFTDNELRWGPDWRSGNSLFVEFLQLDDGAAGRQALVSFLRGRYPTVERLNEAWRTQYDTFEQVGRTPQVGSRIPEEDQDAFLSLIATRYFSVAQQAIRAVDQHHLVLGCRFAGYAPRPVLEGMRDHVDVVSLNHYAVDPPVELLQEIHQVTGRPVLITEFSFRGRDSGLPNTRGAGVIVDTQQERAEHFASYVRKLMSLPMVVGYHWFEHADEPAEGRFDGEDSNYGVVDIKDRPYSTLVEAMTRVNLGLYGGPPASSGEPASRRPGRATVRKRR